MTRLAAPSRLAHACAQAFARDDLSPARLAELPRVTAVGMLVLIGATFPLWTPQDVFPQVPWLSWWVNAPAWLDGLGAGLLITALAATALAPTGGFVQRAAIAVTPFFWLAVLAFDQHRLQPWAYQGLLLSIFAWATPERNSAYCRVLVVSIYLFSAVSKLDFTFLQGMGPEFFRGWATALGAPQASWLPATAGWPSLVFPLGELTVGVLLCLPNCRWAALVSLAFLHGGLLLALGPWGLDHSAGVLVWNVWFLAFDFWLFSPRLKQGENSTNLPKTGEKWALGDALATLTLVAAVLAPLGEPWGAWDAWPSWALYAPRNERVVLLIPKNQVERLPEAARPFVEESRDGLGEARIKLDGWSLAVLRVPLYPSLRFQQGVALALFDRDSARPPQTMRLALGEAADRWTGRRRETVLSGGQSATQRRAYRFNSWPRDNIKR